MKKHLLNLQVCAIDRLNNGTAHIVLSTADGTPMPEMRPGQFVEVGVDKANVLLNRPFSIFNRTDENLELLVKPLGRGSDALCHAETGDMLRVVAPLGRGFSMPDADTNVLLIGGGVGVAPLYYQARILTEAGIRPTLIYGDRTEPDSKLLDKLSKVADLAICTDDGSMGVHGLVFDHPVYQNDVHSQKKFGLIQICGPLKMMKFLYEGLGLLQLNVEFSLENKMACGLGACLCCVEETMTGNRCVCSDGPVFNINELKW